MINFFSHQEMPRHLDVRVDTDYAGCKRTRRSTNGGVVMHGSHIIKSWSTTQSVIALSSGEAEYYGVVKGACEGLGVIGLLADLTGMTLSVELSTDSSAAKAIATRRGVGKVKHLETRTLWVQDQVDRGRIGLRKICGQTNVADLLTKYLSGVKLRDLMYSMPVMFESGRHSLAPMIHE